jgi:hypothetical protein
MAPVSSDAQKASVILAPEKPVDKRFLCHRSRLADNESSDVTTSGQAVRASRKRRDICHVELIERTLEMT